MLAISSRRPDPEFRTIRPRSFRFWPSRLRRSFASAFAASSSPLLHRSSANPWSSYNRKMRIQSKMPAGPRFATRGLKIQCPRRNRPNLAQAERDYSHRLLVDKLGIKAGQRISVMGVESAEFLVELATRVPEYSGGKLVKDADLIFFSAEAKKDLSAPEFVGQGDPAERRDLGGLSQRPETHPRN